MRLNPKKCTFGVEGGKFLGFMLTHWGIKANSEKCQTITEMWSPQNRKEVQQLIGHLTALSRFVPRLAEKTRLTVQLLRKAAMLSWNEKCLEIFQQLKDFLSSYEDLGGSAPMDQAQPLRRKTKSMPQDIGPDQDSPITTLAPSLPQRITRSRAQDLGAEHQ